MVLRTTLTTLLSLISFIYVVGQTPRSVLADGDIYKFAVSQAEQTKSYQQRQHFMTIGNFRHAPNWDAVLYLQKIWPLIRKQLPQAELP